MLLLGLTIEYWYVSLAIVAIVVVAAIAQSQHKKQRARQEKAAHRPGPRDPWLNEVAVALADLGLTEIARNTGAQLGGAPIDGDIGLEAERFLVYVTLFSDQRRARQAELGLRAKPEVRDADLQRRDRDQDGGAGRVRRQRARRRRRRVPPRRGRSGRRTAGGAAAVGRRHGAANRRRPRPRHPARGRVARQIPTCWSSCASSANCETPACSPTPSSTTKKAELLGRI